jgi:hypothetical protein
MDAKEFAREITEGNHDDSLKSLQRAINVRSAALAVASSEVRWMPRREDYETDEAFIAALDTWLTSYLAFDHSSSELARMGVEIYTVLRKIKDSQKHPPANLESFERRVLRDLLGISSPNLVQRDLDQR